MTRRLGTDLERADCLGEEWGFPGARQAAVVEQTDRTIATGELTLARWYLATSLPPGRCGPADRLGWFRGHWSIANRRHRVKDRSWDEDRHTLRRPGLGEVCATLVNASRNFLRQDEWFPERMSLRLRAKPALSVPARLAPALLDSFPDFAIVLAYPQRQAGQLWLGEVR